MKDELKDLVFDDLPELDFGGRNIKDVPEKEFANPSNQNWIGQGLKKTATDIGGSLVDFARGVVDPVDRAVVAYPQQFVKALATGNREPVNTLFAGKVDYPESAMQVTGDVAASSLLIPGFAGAVVKPVIKGVATPIKWVKDAFTGTKKAKQIAKTATETVQKIAAKEISLVESEGIKKSRILSKFDVKKKQALDQESISISKALDSAEKIYKGKIADTSFTKSSDVRKALPQLFKDKSSEYGQGLTKILNNRPISATKSEVMPSIEESLMNHGILGIDDAGKVFVRRTGATKAESNILNEYFRLRNLPDDAVVNASELIQSNALIKPKYGKVWGPSEHLQSEVSEAISGLIAQKSPEVAAYRKSYAPFLDWKKAVIKEFQPFAGKFANKKGSQILSKYADVSKTLSSDEVKLMAELEKQTKRSFTDELKGLRGMGRDIKLRKESSKIDFKIKGKQLDDTIAMKKAEINNLISATIDSIKESRDMSIKEIENETRAIIDALHRRKIIIGGATAATAGPAFFKYIKNRLSYNVFGITN